MIYNDPTGEFFWVAAIWGGIIGGISMAINAAENGGDVLGSFVLGFAAGFIMGGIFGDALTVTSDGTWQLSLFKMSFGGSGGGSAYGGVIGGLAGGKGMQDWADKETGDVNIQYPGEGYGGNYGNYIDYEPITYSMDSLLPVEKPVENQKPETKTNYVTGEQLKQLGWYNVNDEMVKELNRVLKKYEITTPERIRHFISQCMQESNKGKWITEQDFGDKTYFERLYGSGTAKGKEFGHTKKGDGLKYRGAGYLQVTGKPNYQVFANYNGDQKIMNGADYLAKNYAWEAAGYWWKNNKMNSIIDNGASVLEVSRQVNLGNKNSKYMPNHYDNRKKYYDLCNTIIK